mmetsp:Transcript_692/g.1265  ORF Transcript_692/g.1265 Transcript_692/m.1265 type:complete len:383 (+) Transcript_692:2852-4000(+)
MEFSSLSTQAMDKLRAIATELYEQGASLKSICSQVSLQQETVIALLLGSQLTTEQAELVLNLRGNRLEFQAPIVKSAIDNSNTPAHETLPYRRQCAFEEFARRTKKLSDLLNVDKKSISRLLASGTEVELYDYNTRLYSYDLETNSLTWLNMTSGKPAEFKLRKQIHFGSCWVEVSNSDIIFTGGFNLHGGNGLNEVWVVNINREFTIVQAVPMITERYSHSSCYFKGFLYVIAGHHTNTCERMSTFDSAWEAFQNYPTAVSSHSVIVVEQTESLYVVGGTHLNIGFQRLDTIALKWHEVPLKLPSGDFNVPCFKVRKPSSFYLISKKKLYEADLKREQLIELRAFPKIYQNFNGACIFYRDTLFCSNYEGQPYSWAIGPIT